MDVAIIGAGNIGRALSGALVRAGHGVTLSSRSQEGAELVAKETGARAAASNSEAVEGVEAVVLAVPYADVDTVLNDVGGALDGKIVIDVTTPFSADHSGLSTKETSGAELIQAQVPSARVVKAFNTVFASRYEEPAVGGIPLDVFIAADDDAARTSVLGMAASLGFRPVDAGPLSMSGALDWMHLLNVTMQMRHGWSWQTGWKLLGPAEPGA